MRNHSSTVLDTLRDASALLQSGKHVPARELLGNLLDERPDLAEAHWLLAGSYYVTRDFVRAERELRTCICRRPENLNASIMLGRILSETGRPEEAIRVLRGVLAADGRNLDATIALARVMLASNRAEEARLLLEPIAAGDGELPEVWMLYGHALMTLGRGVLAEPVLRRLIRLQPGNDEARIRLAAVLADSGQPVAAEAEVRTVLGHGSRTAENVFVLGRALMGQGRFPEAETMMREVVRARPQHITAQGNLSELVWMRSGDVRDASRPIDRALRAQPYLAGLRIAKARLLMSARRPGEALEVIEEGLVLDGNDSALLKAASTISLEIDAARALDYAGRLLRVAPNDPSARVEFGNASLATGRAQAALEAAEALHRLNPTDGRAIAMKADAMRMLDDPRYRELLDYRCLVRAEPIDVPEGWHDLEAYVADLVADLGRLHTLRAHPIGNSLREGSQITLDPTGSRFASIQAFPKAIAGPIRRYLQALGRGADPMRRRNSGDYRLSGMWSVRLRPHGFHVNHYHPEGWISSACYLQLPAAVGSRVGGEGWLKFGEPAFPTRPPLGPEYFVRPEPGLLVLFPSYMWHGTVPFTGAAGDTRLTVAFDLVPATTE